MQNPNVSYYIEPLKLIKLKSLNKNSVVEPLKLIKLKSLNKNSVVAYMMVTGNLYGR
jgi:hypothetical protein